MKSSKKIALSLIVGLLALAGCGESPDLEPASQGEIQQRVNDAFDRSERGSRARKREDRRARRIERRMSEALEDAQAQTEAVENPSY